MGFGLASRLAYHYLVARDMAKNICEVNSCADAPYCRYMRVCSECKLFYCNHYDYKFGICYGCNSLDINCSDTVCSTLSKCLDCGQVYCRRDSRHRNGLCKSDDDSDDDY